VIKKAAKINWHRYGTKFCHYFSYNTLLKSESNTFLDYFGSEWQNTEYFWKVIKT